MYYLMIVPVNDCDDRRQPTTSNWYGVTTPNAGGAYVP